MIIPQLYATEGIPLNEKIIYEAWILPQVRFYWLIAEYDPHGNIAFGYANLNDDTFAEWGYISIAEIEENGATKVNNWKMIKFPDAKKYMDCLVVGGLK